MAPGSSPKPHADASAPLKLTKEPSVVISPRGVERLRSGHLWVYRSDVRPAQAEAGAIVRLVDERGNFQGRAFYSDKSQIAIRLLTREDRPVDRAFLTERIRRAAAFRDLVVENSQACRLVYSEADLLPSLIVDRYADYLVMQTLSQGTERIKSLLVEILVELFSPRGILERNDPKVRLLEGLEQRVGVLLGEVPPEIPAQENGVTFVHDLLKGQKTGSFLDQRENHQAARRYASGEVLDCFSYQGGFALTVAGKCAHVQGIEMAPAALQAARRNQEVNGITNADFREGNTFDLLKEYDEAGRRFQMVILDPPAFAKNRDSIPAAQRGYKEINLRALKLLKPGGFLLTCSCSYHITEPLFLQILAEAANDAKKAVVVAERRTQAQDHPILLTMPETHYLKCFIIKTLE
ncbi:MAG TPA: class I SAM-dependent rRNA methyltransferase [Candidatus Baltobacteraceae bacterium]|jgi:23S rRNA (cytosine1962-C5)-methyltransferase|nr:class I SAM-dependent rRNA methyltransferase [Candidatus Baltobacteraceae bacterium]